MDVATVAHRLGHANITTTLNVYVHHTADQGKKAAGIMDRILSGKTTSAPSSLQRGQDAGPEVPDEEPSWRTSAKEVFG